MLVSVADGAGAALECRSRCGASRFDGQVGRGNDATGRVLGEQRVVSGVVGADAGDLERGDLAAVRHLVARRRVQSHAVLEPHDLGFRVTLQFHLKPVVRFAIRQ